MKNNYDNNEINRRVQTSPYREMLESLPLDLFLIEYLPDEYLSSPWENKNLFQIVCAGNFSIYYVRDDGSKYSLAHGSEAYCLGEMALFGSTESSVFAQADSQLTCIAFTVSGNEEILLNNIHFLRLISENMSKKLSLITYQDAAPCSLTERVLDYMRYKCENGIMKGIEKSAFHLHCSSRQLQRIMNALEGKNLVEKIGKGSYRLV